MIVALIRMAFVHMAITVIIIIIINDTAAITTTLITFALVFNVIRLIDITKNTNTTFVVAITDLIPTISTVVLLKLFVSAMPLLSP